MSRLYKGKLICGVGKNDIKLKTKDYKGYTLIGRAYELWRSMIKRCYSDRETPKYKSYKYCNVCQRWHIFSNFWADLPKIPGYELWKNNPKKRIALDKDIRGKYHSFYSPHYCCFVTPQENNAELRTRFNIFQTQDFQNKRIDKIAHKIYSININSGFIVLHKSKKDCAQYIGSTGAGVGYWLTRKNKTPLNGYWLVEYQDDKESAI